MATEQEIALTQRMMSFYEKNGMSRRQFMKTLSVVGGGVAVTALLAACGDDEDDSPAPTSPPAPTATAAAADPTATSPAAVDDPTATSEPEATEPPPATGAEPKWLIYADGQDVGNFDPHTGYGSSSTGGHRSVYNSLMIYRGNPPLLDFSLATSMESNDDASVWTATIDDRAVFHDGTPVRASDVVYSVGRYIRKGLALSWLFSEVMDDDGAEAIDDHTIQFNLHTPFAALAMAFPGSSL